MANWTRTFSLAGDFGGSINAGTFHREVAASIDAGDITPNIIGVSVDGDNVPTEFDAEVMGAELVTLNALPAAHDSAATGGVEDIKRERQWAGGY